MHKIVNLQKAFKIANPPIPCMQASTSVYHIQNSKQFPHPHEILNNVERIGWIFIQ